MTNARMLSREFRHLNTKIELLRQEFRQSMERLDEIGSDIDEALDDAQQSVESVLKNIPKEGTQCRS